MHVSGSLGCMPRSGIIESYDEFYLSFLSTSRAAAPLSACSSYTVEVWRSFPKIPFLCLCSEGHCHGNSIVRGHLVRLRRSHYEPKPHFSNSAAKKPFLDP